ncbi:MAG: hypothetical protein R6V01_05970 [Thermoplasmatota archaeon]
MMNRNCWDIKDCGRGPGGRLTGELGECPVVNYALSKKKGVCSCWKVRIKDEKGRPVPNWARPEKNCLDCNVMEEVREKGELTTDI